MKSLHAILKDLENKTPTKEDYLNLYNRIKYSIESAYPIEKRDYSPAKPERRKIPLTDTESSYISKDSSAKEKVVEETGRTSYEYKVLTKTAWIYRELVGKL